MADDPLAPVQPGDDIAKLFSATRHNAYADAARIVRGNLPTRWKRGPKPTPQKRVRVYNSLTGALAYTVEKYNIIGYTWREVADADEDTGTYTLWGGTPTYAQWGVAQQDIPPGQYGEVVVSGLTLARIYDRSTYALSGVSANWRVDVDPLMGTYSGSDFSKRQRLTPRLHGAGRILRASSGVHADWEFAVIDIEGPQPFPVVLKDTTVPTSSVTSAKAMYPAYRSTLADVNDQIDVYPVEYRQPYFCGVGYDAGAGSWSGITQGWATWDLRNSHFRLLEWPSQFLVHTQANLDGQPTDQASVKFWDGSLDIGSAFSVNIGSRKSVSPPTATYTLSAPAGTVARLYMPQHPGDVPALDLSPFRDALYGTIRMFSGVTVSGTGPCHGWLWCDGTSGTPDLRDKFVVGQGTGHTLGNTGGQATHGDGTNDHDNHATTAVQSGTGTTVTTGSTHSETDNEPPWFAVAFAIRKAS